MTGGAVESSGAHAAAPTTDAELDEALSAPTAAVVEALRAAPGDIIVLGAGGKMGPSLARMARRAADALGDRRRITAVSRFSDPSAARALRQAHVETISADLLDRAALEALPDAPNVIFMAGQKFGTSGAPAATWAMNVLAPAHAAERYHGARIVAFSTGNVYPLTAATGGGSRESDPVAPVGEYAQSCVGRERVLEFLSERGGGALTILRLNYANALRYGVLTDLALAIVDGTPIDLTMGYVNVLWQGDANAMTLRSLAHTSRPPTILNLAGGEHLSVRAAAEALGSRLGREPVFVGREAPDALLSDSSRAQSLFGPPQVGTPTLIDWTARWIAHGGATIGKPTRFQARDGAF
jgi:nucleoside-diphosphate-sugar epimerase